MEFNNIPPEWENKGNEPTEDIKKQGFLAGYKPPAAYFNWFWNKTGACIKELQEKLKGLTKKDVGLDKVDNKSLEEILAEVTMDKANAIDTSGLVGTAQENVKAQQLLDELANRVANKLVEKRMIVNNLTTDNPEMLLAAPMGKELKKQLDEQNKNIDNHLQKDGTFYVAGNPDFVFLELQKELLRLRLQIEHHGDVRLWKSEDGGISFPTFKTLITNSDFKKVTCTVDAIADQITEIPDAPKEDGYIHFIRPYLSSSHLSSLNYSQGRWIIYTNKTQKYTITFCKIP